MDLEAHAKPPEDLKALYKRYQKISRAALDEDKGVVDFTRGLTDDQSALFERESLADRDEYAAILDSWRCDAPAVTDQCAPLVFKSKALPGLSIVPGLLPVDCQRSLLDRLLHRDLSKPEHKTNVHFHHELRAPASSFFDLDPDEMIQPKEGSDQRPTSMRKFLNKRLRWVTLGGQYDWTQKAYPDERPPDFPRDLQEMLRGLFPGTLPEAAIVNLYSPGDVLSLHRDVSEYCDNGLISISLGCDGLFVVALDGSGDDEGERMVMRLRSGDAVYMDGPSRYAWHGVPLVLRDTCPKELEDWPAHDGAYGEWPAWMASKRINLNVRQMWRADGNSGSNSCRRADKQEDGKVK